MITELLITTEDLYPIWVEILRQDPKLRDHRRTTLGFSPIGPVGPGGVATLSRRRRHPGTGRRQETVEAPAEIGRGLN
jgi:hypothetical protein